MHAEPGLYPTTVEIVLALNDNVRKRMGVQKYVYNGIYLSLDK